MSRLNPVYRAKIIERIETKEAQLDTLNETYQEALETGKLEEFRFDSGEGSQRVMYRSIKELTDVIANLEAQINLLYRELNGGSMVVMNLRRKHCSRNRRRR